jgi:hypothetical protein
MKKPVKKDGRGGGGRNQGRKQEFLPPVRGDERSVTSLRIFWTHKKWLIMHYGGFQKGLDTVLADAMAAYEAKKQSLR